MKPSTYFFCDGVKIQREDVIFNKEVYLLESVGQRVISKVAGKVVCLTFLQHPWSGSILIRFGNKGYFHDLYSPTHKRCTIIHEIEAEYITEITVTVISSNNQGHTECWLESIAYYDSREDMEKHSNVPLILTHTPYGDYLVLENDLQISHEILNNGVWSPDDVKIFETVVNENDLVVDIGANIGACSVIFSKLVGRGGKVFCFEPQGLLFNVLRFNMLYNAYSPFEVFNIGLAESDTEMHMPLLNYSRIDNFGGIAVEEINNGNSDNKVKVSVVKGAPFLKSLLAKDQKIAFIKIDVESFELPVLLGLKEILNEMKPSLFVEISPFSMKARGHDYKDIYELLAASGYIFFHKVNHTVQRIEISFLPNISEMKEERIWDLLAIPKNNQFLIKKIEAHN